jgi:hypothetical protein
MDIGHKYGHRHGLWMDMSVSMCVHVHIHVYNWIFLFLFNKHILRHIFCVSAISSQRLTYRIFRQCVTFWRLFLVR